MFGSPALARIRTLFRVPSTVRAWLVLNLAILALSRSFDLMTIDLPGSQPILYQLLYHTSDMRAHFLRMGQKPYKIYEYLCLFAD